MEKKAYAVIGGWGFRGGVRGINTYTYDPQTSKLTWIESKYPDIAVGNQFYDQKSGILYFTDERRDQRGRTGGGGSLCAARLNPADGTVDMMSEKQSLLTNPSYVAADRSGRYAMVTHHVTDNYITRLVRREDGSYGSETVFEKAALVLFRLNQDGSLGEICDVYETLPESGDTQHPVSHQHCAVADPSGEIYIVCDKGLDRLYSFRIDRRNGKLVHCHSLEAEAGSHPRYGVFHPKLPYFYCNHEEALYVAQYRIDQETAEITSVSRCGLLEQEAPLGERSAPSERAAQLTQMAQSEQTAQDAPSDIVISRDGRHLYVSIRGLNVISALAVSEDGNMELIQNISCGGENPRGLCLSPDGAYLYVCNVNSDRVVSFAVKSGGRLEPTGIWTQVSRPGNMNIVFLEESV